MKNLFMFGFYTLLTGIGACVLGVTTKSTETVLASTVIIVTGIILMICGKAGEFMKKGSEKHCEIYQIIATDVKDDCGISRSDNLKQCSDGDYLKLEISNGKFVLIEQGRFTEVGELPKAAARYVTKGFKRPKIQILSVEEKTVNIFKLEGLRNGE